MEQQEEQEQRRWKRGNVGPDGRVFNRYLRSGKEIWFETEGEYEELKLFNRTYAFNRLKAHSTEEHINYLLLKKSRRDEKVSNEPVYMKKDAMLHGAKQRAKKFNLECSITLEDIEIPKVCPIFKTPIEFHFGSQKSHFNSPSLDKMDPSKGYTKENIGVISYGANRLKGALTLREIILLIGDNSQHPLIPVRDYLIANLPKAESPV